MGVHACNPLSKGCGSDGETADEFLGKQASSPSDSSLRSLNTGNILVRAGNLRPIPVLYSAEKTKNRSLVLAGNILLGEVGVGGP